MDPALAREVAALARNRALNEAIEMGGSDIQQFYKDTTILITGGSGFLGKQLIEKLFRSCDIKKVYLLMRPKKKKAFYERLNLLIEDPVFDALKKVKPNFVNSIYPVQGDVAEPGLGISDQDRSLIIQEVDVIIHAAATIKFDEPLKLATLTNVRGTLEMLELAKSCIKLKSMVHVSTAYSHATKSRFNEEVREQFYKPPLPPKLIVEMVQTTDEQRLNEITPALIENWPNTYTFTKAIAEEACRQAGAVLPICIVRPSIVICSNREPSPGWLDSSCAYGPSGILVGAGLGIMHVINLKANVKIDIIPVDNVNNAIIAAGWFCSTQKIDSEVEPKIYTVTSSRNPLSFDNMISVMKSEGLKSYPSPKMMYYPFMIETPSRWQYTALVWLLHYIPGYVLDVFLWLFGKQQIAVKLYTKANKLFTLLSYFSVNEWKFDDTNLRELFLGLSDRDKLIYNFDVTKLDWFEQSTVWCLGVRKYLIKDDLQGTEYAKKKIFWFKLLNYLVVCPLYAFLVWTITSYAVTGLYLVLSYVCGLIY